MKYYLAAEKEDRKYMICQLNVESEFEAYDTILMIQNHQMALDVVVSDLKNDGDYNAMKKLLLSESYLRENLTDSVVWFYDKNGDVKKN